jgi:uncharacterized damage-inducible protein DinB
MNPWPHAEGAERSPYDSPMSAVPSELRTFYDGWANHERLIVDAIRDLTADQLGSRPVPDAWSIWQLAGHVAGSRSYWFQDILGEGDPALRDRFRVASTTVPDLPLEDAGWEDDEEHPRSAPELVDGLDATWAMIDACLRRWTTEDLAAEFSRSRRSGKQTISRAWVIWHLMEHDVHHGGEISLILGTNDLHGLEL